MKLFTIAMDLLFPRKCPFCTRILDDQQAPLCPACQPRLPWLTGAALVRKPEFVTQCVSPLFYRGRVVDSIHRYKFGCTPAYAYPYGILMAQCIQDHFQEPFDLITWVPLSRKRLRERGFDQAEKLARVVGKLLDTPVIPVLRKVRHTAQQSLLTDPAARKANALNAYEVLPGLDLAGKRVMLIDDVTTSGATFSECARVLRMEGAESIFAGALAQAGTKNEN